MSGYRFAPPDFAWTEEKVEALRKGAAEGLSYADLAERLGAPSRSSIGGKCSRLGIKIAPPTSPRPVAANPRAWTPDAVAELRRHIAAGHGGPVIAAKMGVSYDAVTGKAKGLGLSLPRPAAAVKFKSVPAVSRRPKVKPEPKAFAAPKLEPRPKPVLRVVHPYGPGRPFTALEAGQCRWPRDLSVHVETTADSLFCGEATQGGSYCCAHARLAFHTPFKWERDAVRPLRGAAA